MSEQIVNDINSNGADFDKTSMENTESCSDLEANDKNDAEHDGTIGLGNVSSTQEVSILKRGDLASDTDKIKRELVRLKAEHKASLERENELSKRVQKFHSQTVQIAELEILNEELREQLNDSLKECGCLKQDLER